MAGANLPAKKYSKTNPTITRLAFACTGNATQFIDIAAALSAINRKFYRQGVYYYVNSVEIYNNESGVVDLHTVPDTWVTKNAWNRGFKLFQKMNSLVDDVSNVGRPAYHDYKVYMNYLHRSSGTLPPVMSNINAATDPVIADEWVYSTFTSAEDTANGVQDADEFFSHIVGGHAGNPGAYTSIGLIKSYAETRNTVDASSPNDSQVDITDPLLNLFDFSSEDQMDDIVLNLRAHNDSPPYNFDHYVGETEAALQHVARIGTEQGVGRVGRASGFCAPMGLICVDPFGVSTDFRVVLNLAVGTYHGVYAERA